MIPVKVAKLFFPKEVKDMLDKLKGSRTLLLLVIANLPEAAAAIAKIIQGSNEELATNVIKAVTGFVSILTVLVRFIPDGSAPAR